MSILYNAHGRIGKSGPPPSPFRSAFFFVFSFVLLAAASVAGASVFEPLTFSDPAQAARYRTLIEELRCLVCQNQSLADSNAELAADLRREVYEMVSDGADEDTVKDFMVSRYSEYVLYDPPVTGATVLLWAGPLLFVLAGFVLLVLRTRRRSGAGVPEALSQSETKRIEELLEHEGSPGR